MWRLASVAASKWAPSGEGVKCSTLKDTWRSHEAAFKGTWWGEGGLKVGEEREGSRERDGARTCTARNVRACAADYFYENSGVTLIEITHIRQYNLCEECSGN
jgi:hypothetical protein